MKKTEENKEQEKKNQSQEEQQTQNKQQTENQKEEQEKTEDQEASVEQEEKQKEAKESEKEEKKSEKATEKQEKSDQEKLQEMQDKYLRLTAEYDNYRKRTLKEKMELTKSAGEDILNGLLPVMDDFERALQSIDDSDDLEAVKKGIHLIYSKFKDFMKQNGVKEIEAKEQEFDTDKHEAVSKIPAPSEELKGKVVDVVQKGYYLNDKILRYSKVVIGE
jgi:molecular chaperone GrpE